MDPAPYGGFMTRTIDEENDREKKLELQQVDVSINGESHTLRPEALHIRGVDNLSTEDIQAFVDYYINYTKTDAGYEAVDELTWFRVQWIDDTNVNVVFKTHEDANLALTKLSISSGPNGTSEVYNGGELSQEYVLSIVQERESKPYNPSIEFHKYQKEMKRLAEEEKDLFEAKKELVEKEKEDATEMDEDETSVVLYIRQSLQSDRKVKNAAAYSRYYLLHGEPDRLKPRRGRNGGGRGNFSRDLDRQTQDLGEDLFAEKLKTRARREVDEDLFADKLRERSPTRQ